MTILEIDDLKRHLNIIGHDDDVLLDLKIQAAEGLVESCCGVKLSDYYDDATEVYSVPAPLLEAIRQIAGNLYEDRSGAPVSTGTAQLLAPYRMWSL
jgi:uncharacterized phage protein (predicted DNA packaging)